MNEWTELTGLTDVELRIIAFDHAYKMAESSERDWRVRDIIDAARKIEYYFNYGR